METVAEIKDIRTGLEKYQATKDPILKNTMSVSEMRRLLGVKKTESYWLVHRNFFETRIIDGIMRVDIASFEKWYANQVKHKKVTGEPPGEELKKRSYSFRDVANILGVNDATIYEIWRKENLDMFTVDFVRRIPIEAFDRWYESQTQYQKVAKIPTITELKEKFIQAWDAAELLGITKEKIAIVIRSKKYGDIFEIVVFDNKKWITKKSFQQFLNVQNSYQLKKKRSSKSIKTKAEFETKEFISRQDAAAFAGVTTGTISKWTQMEKFPCKGAGKVLRIHRKEFLKWLKEYKEGVV
ncbi:MAG: helix-turn-helix domain-containing protein [Lachnospiraceae bacterium]|nr:helix-turn-helix domain-containing protein [Lachnospiraceae bacterium]